MNKVVLIGRTTRDPDLKFLPNSDRAVTNFILAVDRTYKKDGEATADFIPVVVYGKQAEATAQYVTKGKLVGVAGRIHTRSYENKDGNRVYVTEVVADEVKFLQWDRDSAPKSDFEQVDIDDSDIPF